MPYEVRKYSWSDPFLQCHKFITWCGQYT